jgi:hypothetical protein
VTVDVVHLEMLAGIDAQSLHSGELPAHRASGQNRKAVSYDRNKNWLAVNAKSFGFKCFQSAGIGAGLATAGSTLVGTPVL